MRSKRLSAAAILPTLAILLLPMAVSSQNVVDLGGRDRALRVEAEEVFSVGSIAGEEWESFARVAGVAFDSEGNLYVLDTQNFRIVKVGPQGQFITEFGRSGGGPGEFGMPMSFTVTPTGEVRVYDLSKQGFTIFNPDGSFQKTVSGTGGDMFFPNGSLMSLPNGDMVDGGPASMRIAAFGGGSDELAPRPVSRFSVTGDLEITSAFEAWNPLFLAPTQRDETVSGGGFQVSAPPERAFDPGLFVGVLPNGQLAVADSTTYTIKLVDPGQGIAGILHRPFSPREVSRRDQNAERDRRFAEIDEREASGSGSGRAFSSEGGGGGSVAVSGGQVSGLLRARVESLEFGEEIPVISGMAVDWTGRIWVERTGRRVGEDGPIDLIDSAGTYIGSVQPDEFEVPNAFGPNGLVAYIERDELDVPRVVVKRLTTG